MEPVIMQLDKVYSLSNQVKEALSECLSCETFPKNQVLLKEGQICDRAWFVIKGLLRRYYKEDDKDVACAFIEENEWAISPGSYYDQKESKDYIETLEETQVAYISYQDVQRLRSSFPELYIIENHFIRKMIIQTLEHTRILRLKAEERLAFFVGAYANLFSRVPRKHIASFLGLAKETLSRRMGKQNPE